MSLSALKITKNTLLSIRLVFLFALWERNITVKLAIVKVFVLLMKSLSRTSASQFVKKLKNSMEKNAYLYVMKVKKLTQPLILVFQSAYLTNTTMNKPKDAYPVLKTVKNVKIKTSALLAQLIQLFLNQNKVNLVKNVLITAKLASSIL